MFTVILYLSYHQSTAFPKYEQKDFALPKFSPKQEEGAAEQDDSNSDEDTDSNADGEEVLNPRELQQTCKRGLLNDDQYSCWNVRPGDMAMFSQATMHFGTANKGLSERMALFSVFTPFSEKRQDDHQIFRSVDAVYCSFFICSFFCCF